MVPASYGVKLERPVPSESLCTGRFFLAKNAVLRVYRPIWSNHYLVEHSLRCVRGAVHLVQLAQQIFQMPRVQLEG